MNKELEVRPVTPRELVEQLEALVEQMSDPERKYQLQVGLKDVEFEVDVERAQEYGVSFPCRQHRASRGTRSEEASHAIAVGGHG